MNQHTTVSRSENADDYFKVVISLNTRWRVIECPDGIQWILQYRASAETYATAPWTGRSCCRIREALIRCISEYWRRDAVALDKLASLPEWCSA